MVHLYGTVFYIWEVVAVLPQENRFEESSSKHSKVLLLIMLFIVLVNFGPSQWEYALVVKPQTTIFFKISIFKYQQSHVWQDGLKFISLHSCEKNKFLWPCTWFKRKTNIRFIMKLYSSQLWLYWTALRRGLNERMKGLVHAYDLLSPSYILSAWLQKLTMLYPLKPIKESYN